MIWLPIPKKDPKTSKSITQYNALRRAVSCMGILDWRNDGISKNMAKELPRLKAALYEENYDAFRVENHGKFWYVILNVS